MIAGGYFDRLDTPAKDSPVGKLMRKIHAGFPDLDVETIRQESLIADSLNIELPLVEVARLSNAAARMMQIFQEGLLVLQKLRTGGKQTVVVQHVQVSDGGQAVIAGSVKSETGGSNG
jgi:hypothetical protein